jgi:molybdopterin-guanine dinucleotide biosynthesis protein A
MLLPRRRVAECRPSLGVVLAGGQSLRMGSDKAELIFEGRSLLQRAVDLLQSIGMADIVVSGEREGYRCVADCAPGGGPLVGLLSVMQQHPGQRLLVLPVDMPRLSAEALSRLISFEAEAAAVHFVDAVLPLRVDADSATIAATVAQVACSQRHQRSLRALAERVGACTLPLPLAMHRDCLRSCNTPQEWQAMQA